MYPLDVLSSGPSCRHTVPLLNDVPQPARREIEGIRVGKKNQRPHPSHLAAQAKKERREVAVACRRSEDPENLVQRAHKFQRGFTVHAFGTHCFYIGDSERDLLDLTLRGSFHTPAQDLRPDNAPHLEKLVYGSEGYRRHLMALTGQGSNKPFVVEPRQGITHRRDAESDLGCQLLLRHPCTGFETAIDNVRGAVASTPSHLMRRVAARHQTFQCAPVLSQGSIVTLPSSRRFTGTCAVA